MFAHILTRFLTAVSAMEYWSIALLIAIGAFGISYLFKNFNFFKRNGIIHVPSIPIIGVTLPFILGRASIGDVLQKVYRFHPNAKYVGYYDTTRPVFLLRDPELIKEIFIKNFDVFPGQQFFKGVTDSFLIKRLLNLEGEKWRDMRKLLSPTFSSSKLKNMSRQMLDCAKNCAAFLSTLPAGKNDLDVEDVFTKYMIDASATCFLGIEVNSIKNPSNNFYVQGNDMKRFLGFLSSKFIFISMFPKLGRIFDIRLINNCMASFFKDIVKTTIETRDAENITRPDLIQQLMDIRGKRTADKELDIDDITAQVFDFFLAGVEISSRMASFGAHEIAANPDVQARLRREIDEVLEETSGQVTYEAVNKLEYLDAVINETLRLYPASVLLERKCQRSFELPPALPGEKPFVLRKGMTVALPIYAIHHDEKYYPEPKKFRPERFLNGESHPNSQQYLSFGAGPKTCIGNRFALLALKFLLFHLMTTCELKPCAKTTLPMKLSNTSFSLTSENGFWLNIRRRSDMHPAIRAQMDIE